MKILNPTEGIDSVWGPQECVRKLAQAGFDAVDFSFFSVRDGSDIWWQEGWQELAQKVKETAQECGVEIRQSHAPFPTSGHNEGETRWAFEAVLRAMDYRYNTGY